MDQPKSAPSRFGRLRPKGMTLIEILISIAISAILMSAGYAVYAAAVSGWNKSRRRTDMRQRARVALDLMERCLRAGHVPDSADQIVFEGLDQQSESGAEGGQSAQGSELDMDAVTFRTNAPIHLFGDKEVPDQTEVEFYIEATEDEETGEIISSILYMRVDDTYDTDPTSGGWIVEAADWVQQMNIAYFNGSDWVESWSSSDGAPKAVEVGLVILDPEGKENPMPVARIVPIQCWREPESKRPVPSEPGSSFGETRARGAEGQTPAEASSSGQSSSPGETQSF